MNEWRAIYDISQGDETIKLVNAAVEKYESRVSVQVDTSADFDGTNTRVQLVQSNVFNLDVSQWHPLPEAPLELNTGADSGLLSTFSFTARYLAIKIEAGNASAGVLSITTNYNK